MSIGFWQIAIVVVLVVLLFGRGKISSLMGDVAKGIKSFKKGMSDSTDSTNSTPKDITSDEDQNSEKKQFTMPQIGWFEILIVVILAVLIIGPKDFPVMLRSIGGWVSSFKKYFSDIQKDISNLENTIDENIEIDNKYISKSEFKKKDE